MIKKKKFWEFAKRVEQASHHKQTNKQKVICEATDLIVTMTVVIISQSIHVSDHHIVHFKYILQFYLSIIFQ